MDTDTIYRELTPLLRDVLGHDDLLLTPELTAQDVKGWDSFKQIEIVIAVEEHFGIKFSTREVDGLANVGDLAAVILRKAA